MATATDTTAMRKHKRENNSFEKIVAISFSHKLKENHSTMQSAIQQKRYPSISIITVVLNNKKGFRLTAESVISQTAFDKLEWIVIDAASTDGTVDTIKEFDSKIAYWKSEPDKGIYDGMNKGIAQATGKYMLFLNAGDTLCNYKVIESVINDNNFGKADHLTGNQYLVADGKIVSTDLAKEELTTASLFLYALPHQSTFIRGNRLKETGGYDISYKICADAKFTFMDIVMKGGTYRKLDHFISNYDASGISTTNPATSKKERERFLKELLPPMIYEDYRRTTSAKSIERIITRINSNSITYKIIRLFCFICYAPIHLKNKIRTLL